MLPEEAHPAAGAAGRTALIIPAILQPDRSYVLSKFFTKILPSTLMPP
jgi:hypothetical protein